MVIAVAGVLGFGSSGGLLGWRWRRSVIAMKWSVVVVNVFSSS